MPSQVHVLPSQLHVLVVVDVVACGFNCPDFYDHVLMSMSMRRGGG